MSSAGGKASAEGLANQIPPDKQMRGVVENRLVQNNLGGDLFQNAKGNGNPAQDLTWATTTPNTYLQCQTPLTFSRTP